MKKLLMIFIACYCFNGYAMELRSQKEDTEELIQLKSHFALGKMLFKGQGCEKDYVQAREHFEKIINGQGPVLVDLKIHAP